jgi:hypothetical protein
MGRNAEFPVRLINIYINYEYIALETKELIFCLIYRLTTV